MKIAIVLFIGFAFIGGPDKGEPEKPIELDSIDSCKQKVHDKLDSLIIHLKQLKEDE